MKNEDKIVLIRKWYAEGKIKKLGDNSYSVPVEAFAQGITPTLVHKTLSKRG